MRRAVLLAALLATAACAGRPVRPWEYSPVPLADTIAIHEPEERETSLLYDQVHGVVSGMGRAVDPNRRFGQLPPALNADPFDGVVNSSWFTNRIGLGGMSPETVGRGPHTSDGPDVSGPIEVVDIKSEGITSGFQIKDAAGQRWFIKFDPPENWEMTTGAEAVATQLFWAAGYNVPENFIFDIDPSKLVLDEEIAIEVVEDDGSVTRYSTTPEEPDVQTLTPAIFVENVLGSYPRNADGTVRSVASKFLSGGPPKGPFSWQGTREDDPNDVIPHEHRRELRGLYPIASWLNHVDLKQGNTLDMFIVDPRVPDDDDVPKIGWLRHHLIDFGSALGSGASRPHNPRHGTELDFDAGAIFLRFFTLGLYKRPWQNLDMSPEFPASTGYYSIDNYDPADWRPNLLVLPFINKDARDGFWGAKIVMAFTDAHLEAALGMGRYSDPAAVRYLLEGMRARRDATGRYWFSKVTPIDAIRVDEGGALVFDDLWQRHFGGSTRYTWELDWDAGDVSTRGSASEARIALPPSTGARGSGDPDDTHARLRVRKVFDPHEEDDDGGEAPRPAEIWLAPEGGGWRVAGVRF